MSGLRPDRTPLYVALIGFLATGAGFGYNFVSNQQTAPCAIAREWIGDETPNPHILEADRVRLSALMVKKMVECTG